MEWWVSILWSEWISWRLLLLRNVFLVFTMRTQSRFSTISMFWHVLHCKFMGISMFGWGKCLRLVLAVQWELLCELCSRVIGRLWVRSWREGGVAMCSWRPAAASTRHGSRPRSRSPSRLPRSRLFVLAAGIENNNIYKTIIKLIFFFVTRNVNDVLKYKFNTICICCEIHWNDHKKWFDALENHREYVLSNHWQQK